MFQSEHLICDANNAADSGLGFGPEKSIEEKTRQILGWSGNHTPSVANLSRLLERPSASITSSPITGKDPSLPRKRKSSHPVSTSSVRSAAYPYSLIANENRAGTRKGSLAGLPGIDSFRPGAGSSGPIVEDGPDSQVNVNGTCGTSVLSPPGKLDVATKGKAEKAPRGNGRRKSMPSLLKASPTDNRVTSTTASPPPTSTAIAARTAFSQLKALLPNLTTQQGRYRALLQTVAQVIELEAKLANLQEDADALSDAIGQSEGHVTNLIGQNFRHASNSSSCTAISPVASPISKVAPPTTTTTPLPPAQFLLMPFAANCTISAPPQDQFPIMRKFGHFAHHQPAVPDDLLSLDVSAFRSLVQNPPQLRYLGQPPAEKPPPPSYFEAVAAGNGPAGLHYLDSGSNHSMECFSDDTSESSLDSLACDTTLGLAHPGGWSDFY